MLANHVCRMRAVRPSQLNSFSSLNAFRSTLRRFASAPSAHVERVTIPCASNGSISIDIHHPPSPPKIPRLLIHLPSHASRDLFTSTITDFSGPQISARSLSRNADDTHTPSILSYATRATIVSINYRLSPTNRFPTPVHDVLAGYDWIVKNLAEQQRIERLGVYGHFIGGALAIMLGCTENRASDNIRIGAVVARDAMCNWVLEEELGSLPQKQGTTEQETTDDMSKFRAKLMDLRQRYFPAHNPGSYFDAFASPLFLLRTPGILVPPLPKRFQTPDEERWAALIGLEDFESGRDTSPSHRSSNNSADGLDDAWTHESSGHRHRPTSTADHNRGSKILEFSEIISDGDTTIVDSSEVGGLHTPASMHGTVGAKKPSKRMRRYPPVGVEDVDVPRMLLLATSSAMEDLSDGNSAGEQAKKSRKAKPVEGILERQNHEFARLMRKTLMGGRFDGVNQTEIERILKKVGRREGAEQNTSELERMVVDARDWAENRIDYSTSEVEAGDEAEVREIGRWFVDALE